jgi:predicted ferric reductase
MIKILRSKYDISILLLGVATIGLWITDYIGKNVQFLKPIAIIGVTLLLVFYTCLKIYKPYGILHKIVAIVLFLVLVPYFLWSVFSFSMYGFNGAKLPYYCYLILSLNFVYILLAFKDGVISTNKKPQL